MGCNKCFQNSCYCQPITNKTIINSDVAGREGLSAKAIAELTGKFPGGTDAQFVDWNKGAKGDPGEDGSQQYTYTEW